MNILLVGAGAVGQVYGYHLKKGGAHVSFFVRPKAAAACKAGMVLYALGSKTAREPIRFEAEHVFTELDEVAKHTWDEVWLCVPADALDEGWLASIAGAVGKARIIALPPGIASEQLIRRAFPASDVVPALIGMVSYQAPLRGETLPEPGIAFYFQPGAPTAFGGASGPEVAKELRRGGCPAVAKKDVAASSAFGSAILMPLVAGLEAVGWSLVAFRAGKVPSLVARAAREAIAITAATLPARAPLLVFLLSGTILKLASWIAPKIAPFDLERYLKHHFEKVGPQTRLLFGEYRKNAESRGLESKALAALLERADHPAAS